MYPFMGNIIQHRPTWISYNKLILRLPENEWQEPTICNHFILYRKNEAIAFVQSFDEHVMYCIAFVIILYPVILSSTRWASKRPVKCPIIYIRINSKKLLLLDIWARKSSLSMVYLTPKIEASDLRERGRK